MEGLQIPKDRNSEKEDAADVEEHRHLCLAVAVKHAKHGGVDREGRYGERVVSVYRLDQKKKLCSALCHFVLVIQTDNAVLEQKTNEYISDNAEPARHQERILKGTQSAFFVTRSKILADDSRRAVLDGVDGRGGESVHIIGHTECTDNKRSVRLAHTIDAHLAEGKNEFTEEDGERHGYYSFTNS